MLESTTHLRTHPVQARAVRTVEQLLSTAATLLDEVGVADFNTNLLAERANVRVRTVYRYFTDKHAIILCLAEAMYARADESLSHTLAVLGDPNENWEEALDEVIDDYFRIMGETPGWVGIRRALQAVPGLDELRVQVVSRHIKWFTDALVTRTSLRRSRARLVATTAFAAGSALLEPALRGGRRRRKAMSEELKLMLRCYLASYLE